MDIHNKLELLKQNIKSCGSLLVAFSGGVDSTFLLAVAFDVLGENVLAVTARSSTYPEREFREAEDFVRNMGINHMAVVSEELDVEGFSTNPPNRCYLCKKELFQKLKKIAGEKQISFIAEGSNHDDLSDYRPGLKAISELGIISPLREAGLTKEEIRILSREMGLKTWDKPSFACLSSRFPYGQTITKEKLDMVDKAEQHLFDLGFKQVRVRHHGEVARIELIPAEIAELIKKPNLMQDIYSFFKKIGFTYAALDLKGYRTGSMNENL